MPRPKSWRSRRVMSEHAFDKLRALDCTFSEFELACEGAEVIEEQAAEGGNKELLLTLEWSRPLHIVVVDDEEQDEDRIVTVYEPFADRWSPDFRRRL